MPTNVIPMGLQEHFQEVVQLLPSTATSGQTYLKAPFDALYIGVINPTNATIYFAKGQLATQPPEAIQIGAGGFQTLAFGTFKDITVWWSSGSAPGSNNQVQFFFSNEPLSINSGTNVGVAANVTVTSMPQVTIASMPQVAISSLPALPAGTNAIGHVTVDALPTLPAGTNQIGHVVVDTLPSLPAGTNVVGHVLVDSIPALPAGTNQIGHVVVDTLPALPAGTNRIGQVIKTSGSAPTYITAAATTTVKTGTGVVGKLINAGTATTGNVTVYDSTTGSGNLIWQGTLTAGQVLPLEFPFGTGLTVVTAATGNLAVSYA